MVTSNKSKSYKRRLTKDLTSQLGNLTDAAPGVLTQKTASTGPFKTFIFDNWTNTLRKVGVNPSLLKKQPNLLEPH